MSFIRKFRKFLIDVFGFSKTETNGFLVLMFLVFAVAALPKFFFHFYEPDFGSDKSLAIWVRDMEKSISLKEERKKQLEFVPINHNLRIDPNTDSAQKLREAGFTEIIANRIVNYRNKGGNFRKKEDVKKIYGFSDDLYERVKSSIFIPEKVEVNENDLSAKPFAALEFEDDISFDLNSVTIEELKKIRGIGEVLSKRIIKYRDLLGGYQDVIQLNEVFGLKPEVIQEISRHASVITPHQKIPINQIDSINVLAKHPYIDYALARVIINYRTVHGDFGQVSDLQNIKVLDDSLYHKIAPYLSL